jgi:hypothetical protein
MANKWFLEAKFDQVPGSGVLCAGNETFGWRPSALAGEHDERYLVVHVR